MNKIIIYAVVTLILMLDWAALHDIIKGESNPYLEYLMIIDSIIIFGLIYKFSFKKGRR